MDVRKVYLNMVAEQKRGAVVEEEKVVEWLFDESGNQQFQSGNIYLGKVMDIIPGMEAAFVHIGADKNGFLYRDELLEYQRYKDTVSLEENNTQVPSINRLLTKGQAILVQITKESVGTKGARLTEISSLPGKFIIYIPKGNYVAVSKKMSTESVREKWRKFGKEWLREKEGMIIRTAAEKVDESVVVNELNASGTI
ncbi:MAG: ribonuclease E/G [Bacillus sp. (in: Bacteria)]|nr:ribonuclease E/G [Bacillus sp. (in: firmicutes)]